jgi:hypothetical protein
MKIFRTAGSGWGAAFVVIFSVLFSIYSLRSPILAILGITLLIVEGGYLWSKSSFRVHKGRVSIERIAAFVAIMSVVGILSNGRMNWISLIEIKLGFNGYEKCRLDGKQISKDERISVCERENIDGWGITRAVIYDSSDQIILPEDERTLNWNYAAAALGHSAPFGISDFSAKKITGHFYMVYFNQQSS